tara:strand:+ start:3853 stop:4281 length:429 start_codon:yes stop_codon:yes gene_type:complete
MLDKKFFTSLASKMRKDYVNHIFEKGRDVYGRGFKNYSKEYGIRKRANSFKRQSGAFANKTSPVLTGDLMNDAKPSSTTSSAKIRFAAHGGKINNLAKMGRVLTDDKQPLPKSVINMIDREVGKEIKLKLPKSKRFKFKLGK